MKKTIIVLSFFMMLCYTTMTSYAYEEVIINYQVQFKNEDELDIIEITIL